MISALYLVLAALHALVWSWGSRAWEVAGRPAALTLVLLPATLLWYDDLRIGLGRFLGEIGFVVGLIATALRFRAHGAAVSPARTPTPSARSPRGRS